MNCGRTTDFFESAARCRINAAFRLASERRIYAAAKNFVVRPRTVRRNPRRCIVLVLVIELVAVFVITITTTASVI